MVYALTRIFFEYCSNLLLFDGHNSLLIRVTVTEHSVFCFMSIVEFTLRGKPYPAGGDFPEVEDLFLGVSLLISSQDISDFVRNVVFFKVFHRLTFDNPQPSW